MGRRIGYNHPKFVVRGGLRSAALQTIAVQFGREWAVNLADALHRRDVMPTNSWGEAE